MENPQILSPEAVSSGEKQMLSSRPFKSYALFAVSVVFVLLGSFSSIGLAGLIIGLASLLVGMVFYRRGK
jgi:hypothetical protein